jgi:hypothetical protein
VDRAIEVWVDEGGARRWVAPKVARTARHHGKLRIGVLCTITIIVVLTIVAKLY